MEHNILDSNLDLDPGEASIYTGHSFFNTITSITNFVFIVQSFFGPKNKNKNAIHPIYGLKLSRSPSTYLALCKQDNRCNLLLKPYILNVKGQVS